MSNVAPFGVRHALPPRYQLQSVLSETSSTSVYRVYDAFGRREQAIKILRHEMTDAQQLAQFRLEFAVDAEVMADLADEMLGEDGDVFLALARKHPRAGGDAASGDRDVELRLDHVRRLSGIVR